MIVLLRQTPMPYASGAVYAARDASGRAVADFKRMTLTQVVRWLEQTGATVRLQGGR